jgi:Tfp pilus assembly protein PilV
MNKKGFNLIEACVAITIFVILLVSMTAVITQGFRFLRTSRVRTQGYNLARAVTERYSNWTALTGLGGNGTYAISFGASPNMTINNINYTANLTIADGPVNPTELKQVDVTVFWTGGNFTITTLKANY